MRDLLADGSPAPLLARSGKQVPIKLKAGAVPADYCIGRDYNQGCFPRRPEAPGNHPETLIHACQSGTALLTLEDGQLLTKHEIFAEQGLTGPKEANDDTQPEPHQIEHGSFDSRLSG